MSFIAALAEVFHSSRVAQVSPSFAGVQQLLAQVPDLYEEAQKLIPAPSNRSPLGAGINIYNYIYILSIGMRSQYSCYTGTCHILLAQVPNQVKRSFSARASC